jgi:PD-(D/E)XK nuclease superfamily
VIVPVVRWGERERPGAREALQPAPAVNGGFSECKRYVFEKPDPGWSLRIDDEPLGEAGAKEWLWEPGFFAGEVTAELLDPAGNARALFLLDVSPDASKLGREIFAQMIEEIRAEDPELVLGSEPATTLVGDLGESDDLWLAFMRLRRHGPEFLRAVCPMIARPRRTLHVRRGTSPLHRARRVDRTTAAGLVRSPAIALFAKGEAAVDLPFLADCRLDVPVVYETLDCAANRAMLALVLALMRRTRNLLGRLQSAVDCEVESETRTLLSRRWPARRETLERLGKQLKRLVRRSPFMHVTRPDVTAAGLTTIATDPDYARAWSQGWRALRRGIADGNSTERMWTSPSWEIYERWCFVRLGRMLATEKPEWKWQRMTDRWAGDRCGRRAELILQPTFPSRTAPRDGLWSISRERVPDIVLRVESADGARFVVLDAKYRTSRTAVLDAMESAHIYQDSLRLGSRRPEASLLLVPAAGGASWLEDVEFHSTHRVGVHVLSPDDESRLPAAVRVALSCTS